MQSFSSSIRRFLFTDRKHPLIHYFIMFSFCFLGFFHALISWTLRRLRIISLETFQRLTLVEYDATNLRSLFALFRHYFD